MTNTALNKTGVALIIVLATILVVTILANIILSVVSNQYSLTRHQTSRISAFYVAKAGLLLAYELLRTGIIARPAAGATVAGIFCSGAAAGCLVNNTGLPYDVTITIYGTGDPLPAGNPAAANVGCNPITASINYTSNF